MKSKHVIIMLAVAAVLGVVVLLLNRGNEEAWTDTRSASGQKVLELPVNDVARVTVQTAGGTVNLAKSEDVWVVQERGNYPASFDRVSNLLRTVWDLKTVQEVNAGASQFPRFELADPPQGAAAKVEFKDKDGKPLGALLLGKKHKKSGQEAMPGAGDFPAGRYIMPVGGSRVLLVSEMFDAVDAKPESWLDREFIKVENPSAVILAGPTGAQKWKLTRESATAEWKLEGASDAENPDRAKVMPITGNLTSPTFTDVLDPATNPDNGLNEASVLTVSTFDGFNYVLRIGKVIGESQAVSVEVNAQIPNERTPAPDEKPEDKAKLDADFQTKQKRLQEKLAREKKLEGRVFLIAKTTAEQLVKERSALLAQPSPSPSPAGAAPVAPPQPGSVTTAPVAAQPPTKAASPTTSPGKPKR